jgi:arylsulfatase A-like enzyme
MNEPRPPYGGFPGTVRTTMAGSEPWWPTERRPPSGAPNVIVVLVDDVGFSDLGCFGGEIDTPNLDRLAAEGVRLTNFHANPMCSPTRASLLTGINCHLAGVGHVAQDDPGFPGYAGELADDVVTAAEILRDAGYATLMVGKWHLARDSDQGPDGPQHSWPLQRGFQRFYGILEAFTNLHHPHALFADNHMVEVDRYPDGYYLTDDLTEQALSMVKQRKAADHHQPFFLYVAHPAAHAPLVAKPEDMAPYLDRYGDGWDAMRAARHARQLELGVLEPDTPLPPRNSEPGDEVRPWDELTADEQRLFARYMAVYAGMVHAIDRSMGRLRAELERMGEWDNTIVVFHSDNGASREGQSTGTTNYYGHLAAIPVEHDDVDLDLARIDEIGGPTAMSHYPRGWAMTSNTPFRLYKMNTHAGGHSVPCIWHWPAGGWAPGTIRRQYGHVTDVLPTLLDALGIEHPTHRHGVPVKPMQGSSLAPVLADAAARTGHTEQYYELEGHRGFMRDGWEVVTRRQRNTRFTDADWELYHLATDPVELHDLAGAEPERVAELARGFDQAAWDNQVYPLDEGSGWRWIVRRPDDAKYEQPVTIWPGTPTLDRWRSTRLIWNRNAVVRVHFAWRPGDRGMLLAHGDQGGGYALYVDDGLVFVYNDGHGHTTTVPVCLLPTGDHEATITFEAPGQRRWTITAALGAEAATIEVPMLFPMAPFEGIDIGIDRRSPVSWALYEREGPFPYTGTIDRVRYEPGDPAPDGPSRFVELARQWGARFE